MSEKEESAPLLLQTVIEAAKKYSQIQFEASGDHITVSLERGDTP